MFDFKRKTNSHSIFYSKPALCVFVVVLCFLIFVTVKVYLKNREASAKRELLQKQLDELVQNKAELEKRIAEIASPAGAEKELREKLNVVRPGEKTIVIVDDKNGKIDATGNQEGIFSEFWQWVKNIF